MLHADRLREYVSAFNHANKVVEAAGTQNPAPLREEDFAPRRQARKEEFRRISRRGAEAQGRFSMGERPAPQRMRALPIHAGRDGIDALRGVPSAVKGRRLSLGKAHPSKPSAPPRLCEMLRIGVGGKTTCKSGPFFS